MCIMTKAFSSQTGFSCSCLCSSHNISVDNKNILMLGHDDIPHPAGLEPASALLQNRQLFLGKNDCALHIDHSLHKFSFSSAEGPCCSALWGWAVLRELQWLRKGRGASKCCLGVTRGWTWAVTNRKLSGGRLHWKSLETAGNSLRCFGKPPVMVLFFQENESLLCELTHSGIIPLC